MALITKTPVIAQSKADMDQNDITIMKDRVQGRLTVVFAGLP